MLTYAELLQPETATAIADRIRGYLLAGGLPTGSWAPSPVGLENLRVEAVAAAVQALMAKRVAAVARGRLLATATDVPFADGGDGPWLSFLGQEVYRLTKRPATKTVKWVALYSTAGSAQPAFDFAPGDLVVRAPATGNRYVSVDGGHFDGTNVLPANSASAGLALPLRFEAERAGMAYADPAGTITEMVSAKAGVRCTNRRPVEFEPAILLGSSGGTTTTAFTSPGLVLPTYTSLIVRVDASGDVGGGAWSWLVPGGAWTPGGPLSPFTSLPVGLTVRMADGGTSPSFVRGDLFVMNMGSDVASQGADAETDAAFARACRFRHLQVSDVPLAGAIELMARAASPEVARVIVDADPDVPAIAVVTMASSVGPASPNAVQAVQAFVGARLKGYVGVATPAGWNSPEERALVVSAQPFAVTAGGVAFCDRATIAAAKVAADVAWIAYLATVPIGPGAAATVELARLEQVVADAGADDMDGTTLNGAAANLAVPAGKVAVPAPGSALSTSLTWVPT